MCSHVADRVYLFLPVTTKYKPNNQEKATSKYIYITSTYDTESEVLVHIKIEYTCIKWCY